MRDRRLKRINQLIKEKVADILSKDSFSSDCLITVKDVETSNDMKRARIMISVIPFSKSEDILKILNKKASFIQRELNKEVEFKFTPRIGFEIDKGEEKAERINRILKEM
ncbi:MAG: 30S ribosome-binding factor RbfA [Candidatus Portnoybacteria bacterium]|nr:30S ribosome-binding factor RbfA [Candidatus Portnoybacteria bacterium]